MKVKAFVSLICILLGLLIAGIAIPLTYNADKIDVTEINRIQFAAKKLINDNIPIKDDFKYEYTLIDDAGKVISGTYPMTGSTENAITDAIANRDTVLVITTESGNCNLIVYTNFNADILSVKHQIATILGSLIGAIIIAVIMIFTYFEIYINRPFAKLHKFAENVAAGDLDTPLVMNKYNSFGAFSEAFDLMRNELRLSKEREKLIEESKKQLIAELSHDIKSPLSSIRAVAEAQEIKSGAKWSGIIVKKVDEVDKLISDIYYSTLNDLSQLKVCLNDVSSIVVFKNIMQADYLHKIRMQTPPDVVLYIDEFRTNEIFANLIVNSYKYADTQIDVDFAVKGGYFIVKVKDYGDGISESDMAYITEKFYRGEKVLNSDGEGLGLYIVKKLVELQHGKFDCYNDDGFAVEIALPIKHK